VADNEAPVPALPAHAEMDDSSKLSLPSPNTIEISQEKDKLR
jgi:hypothetical protein